MKMLVIFHGGWMEIFRSASQDEDFSGIDIGKILVTRRFCFGAS